MHVRPTAASGETSTKDKEPAPSTRPSPSGGGDGGANTAKMEQKVLNNLSLRRLREWIEEDEDAEIARKDEGRREKRT